MSCETLINSPDSYKDELFRETDNSLIKKLFSYFNGIIPARSILPGYIEKIVMKYTQIFPNDILNLIISNKDITKNLLAQIENDSVANIIFEFLNIESNPFLEVEDLQSIDVIITKIYFVRI